jgi:hypothetical protein
VVERVARFVGCALLFIACSGDHASPTQPPQARPDTTTAWIGNSTVIAVTGPDACVAAEQDRYGTILERGFVIDRSGADITLVSNRGPDVGYVGNVRGNAFTAEDPGAASVWTSACGTVISYYGGIEGRFSDDGRSLDATEFWAARLESGGELRWDFELKLAR